MGTRSEALLDKEIDFLCSDEKICKGKVVGLDYDLGITIQSKDHYLLCINGPVTKNYASRKRECRFLCSRVSFDNSYRLMYGLLLRQLEEGFVNTPKIISTILYLRGLSSNLEHLESPSAETCSFT